MFANEWEECLALAWDRTNLAETLEQAEREREEEEAVGEDFVATSGSESCLHWSCTIGFHV